MWSSGGRHYRRRFYICLFGYLLFLLYIRLHGDPTRGVDSVSRRAEIFFRG